MYLHSSGKQGPDPMLMNGLRTPALFIILACDTDPLIGQNGLSDSNKEEIWSETVEAVISLKDLLDRHHDSSSHAPKFTWFLRSDWEMYHTCGDWCFPARRYRDVWHSFEQSGDEIGWHPHLVRLENNTRKWYQEIKDEEWIAGCLKEGHSELSKLFQIESCRTGWTYHSNFTMHLVSKMHVRYDLSALPGMYNSIGTSGLYDWATTPPHPYYPSPTDYRREGDSPDRIELLEIPLTVYKVSFPLRMLIGHRERVCNLSCRPFLFSRAVHHVLDGPAMIKACPMYFHPGDVIHKRGINSWENCDKNLEKLLFAAKSRGMAIHYMTAGEFGRYWITQEM